MSKRTAVIRFGGEDYTIHAFNIGELERVTDILSEDISGTKKGFAILRIAMERAEPKPPEFDTIEPEDMAEITDAANKILNLAGLRAENPPQAVPVAA